MDRRRPRRRWDRRAVAVLVAALAVTLVPVAASSPAGAAPDPNGCFVQRSYQVFLDRDGTQSEIWGRVALIEAGQPRSRVPAALAESDEWLTVEVTALYQQALDRDPDAPGLAFWVGRLRQGTLVNAVASQIYGSSEFYDRAGGTDDGFLTDLYVRILHRDPDAPGLAFWRGQLATRGRGRVAAEFFASVESRRDRVTRLYHEVLDRGPDASGLTYWVGRLLTSNDVWLAASLASSDEFFTRAQVGCELPPRPPPDEVTFTGHGWGHGRGMGQYGARGYAEDGGDGAGGEPPWTGSQILDHFYGGTVTTRLSTDAVQRVYLTASRGQDLIVTQGVAALRVDGYGANVAAVRIRRLGFRSFDVSTSTTIGCSGPWTARGTRTTADVEVRSNVAQTEDASTMLQRCVTSGSIRYYRGSLHAVEARISGVDNISTVNQVGTEAMLRSIVPGEMPALWAAAAVRAQAVAARSYALDGDSRWGSWATTCDSSQCQVYVGYGSRPVGGSTVTRMEHAASDAAVLATARQVRTFGPGGDIARTEFSSSSGGWTVDGTASGGFPAVVDAGDDHPSNSRHTWTETFTRTQIEAAFGCGCGSFVGFDQWSRNGLGDMGGRVNSVRIVFTGGSLTRTGDQVRIALGLNSNWFTA